MLQLERRLHISRENRKYLVMLWQRTHSPAKDPSNRFLTKVQHNFETAPHQTKFRCQQSRGWSQSEEASANPLRGLDQKNEQEGGQEGRTTLKERWLRLYSQILLATLYLTWHINLY